MAGSLRRQRSASAAVEVPRSSLGGARVGPAVVTLGAAVGLCGEDSVDLVDDGVDEAVGIGVVLDGTHARDLNLSLGRNEMQSHRRELGRDLVGLILVQKASPSEVQGGQTNVRARQLLGLDRRLDAIENQETPGNFPCLFHPKNTLLVGGYDRTILT